MNPQIAYLLNLSIKQIESKRLDDAERTLNQIIKAQPKNADALSFLSVVNAYRSKYAEALFYISKAIEQDPRNSDAFNNKGNILRELGRITEATEAYEKAIRLNPKNAEAFNNLGVVQSALNKRDEAVNSYRNAITLMPNYAEAFSNLGNILSNTGYLEESLQMYQRAISLKPNYVDAMLNKGLVLSKLKKFNNALESCNEAILINPSYPPAWTKKGIILSENGFHEDAIHFFDKAIEIDPNYSDAWACKGTSLIQLKRHEDALVSYERAFQIDKKLSGLLGDLIHLKQILGLWPEVNDSIKKIEAELHRDLILINPFNYCCAIDSPEGAIKVAKKWVERKYPLKNRLPTITSRRHPKIRIGYFSADFKTHPVAQLTAELFEMHNRNVFEVHAFSVKDADTADPYRDRLVFAFDNFINVQEKTEIEVAQIARNMEIDIAIDLGGHTLSAPTGIMSYRAAPIQVNYLGYPGTMGAEYMDYIIADSFLIPEDSRQFYCEKVVYLPGTFMVDDSKRKPSNKNFLRKEFGLPESGFIFCCFNNSYKVNSKMIESWANILRSVSNSVLWISDNNESFRRNILAEFQSLDISKSRIIFASRIDLIADHLARLRLANLFLDTHPYNAHTTAVDALKAEVPVLTCAGRSFPGRVASSLLNSIGLPELVSASIKDYEQIAIRLATDPEEYMRVKNKLKRKNEEASLFNTQSYVKNIETAYLKMYEKYSNGRSPDHIFLDN